MLPLLLWSLFPAPVALAQDDSGVEEETPASGPVASEPDAAPDEVERPQGRFDVDLELAQSVGVLDGHQILDGFGPVTFTEVSVTPEYRRGPWRLEFPVDVSHLQTYGFGLAELRGRVEAQAKLQGDVLWGEVAAGFGGAFRPHWPDPYKVDANGEVLHSSRQSYILPEGQVAFGAKPSKHHRFELSYGVRSYDYADDPDFDPVAEPTHLTPGDHFRHLWAVSWTGLFGPLRIEIGTEGHHSAYTKRYARDASTGLTHAGAGGADPNPMQKILSTESGAQARWHFGEGPVTLRAGYGFEADFDLFQGYYSYTGHHPSLGFELAWEDGPEIDLRGDVHLRRYGKNGYAEGTSHPALDYGDRRASTKASGSLTVDVPVIEHLSVILDGEVVGNVTNFPDYEAGVYPAGSQYDIDWDYVNWMALVGVKYRL